MNNLAAVLVLALFLATQSLASEQPNKGLVALVSQVRIAADRRDFESLRSLMVSDFQYSFGGNRSRDEAIEWYRDRPSILSKLASVLSGDCALVEYDVSLHYVCPAVAVDPDKPYTEYRAGFRLKDHNNWQFIWFVAGD